MAEWYVNVNDLIGGFCIGTSEGPLSENRHGDDIADMLTEDNARRIVADHDAGIWHNDDMRVMLKTVGAQSDAYRKALLPFAAAIREMDIPEEKRGAIVVEFGLYQITWQHFYDALTAFLTLDTTGELAREPLDNSDHLTIIEPKEETT